MIRLTQVGPLACLCVAVPLFVSAPVAPVGSGGESEFSIARVYWEYNASANDLGVHVTLDGEDWQQLAITNPSGKKLFQVKGSGPYRTYGMTELFFEGAEPSLDDVPLAELLAEFPEGEYEFEGVLVDGAAIDGESELSHAIPDGPVVSAETGPGGLLRILWSEVTSPPPGFPAAPIQIAGYQVIVEPSFQLTLPAQARSVTVSPEFVRTLGAGIHKYEVLAIEVNGNQTLTEGEFEL